MSEQFENIIRKKLQEAEPSFDPAAWDQMKKKLDDADRRRPFFWWWAGGLLLIVGLGGWWWFGTQRANVNEQTKSPIAAVTDANTPPAGENVNNIPPSANTGAGAPGVNNPAGKNDHTTKGPLSKNTPAGGATLYPNSGKVVDNPVQTAPSSVTGNNTQVPANVHNQPTSSSPVTENAQTPAATPENVNNPATASPLPAVVPATPANVDNPAQKTTDSAATGQDQKEKRPAKKQKRGFDGGLFLGPDLNVTPAFEGLPIGATGGLIIRYHVNNRWYLSTGVGYAKKLYGATPAEYSTTYPPNFYAIDADCDVIDIPLNVSYTFAQGKTSSWSAMVGASSYLMVKEKYEYYYPNDIKYSRQYNNQNQHYFSVINLGVTWEKQTKSRLSWGLQPYVKIPLSGVGQGKVRVYSAGVTVQAILGKKKD